MSIHLTGKPLIEVTRGGHIESIHHVAACACNAQGDVKMSIGNIDTPVFVRSALKPIIAATVAVAALQAGLVLESEELALIAASHFGEDRHLEVVKRLLARSGSSEADLQCGAARPRRGGSAVSPQPIYNNCSGKHAGLLLLCKLLGVDNAEYLLPSHAVNKAWMATAGRIYGIDALAAPQGVDGCGLPVFAVSLHAQAQGYARFATLRGIAERDRAGVDAVRKAMMAHPQLVGGIEHLDTRLMSADPGTILAKLGAEGVHCSAVAAHDVALVIKVLDGHERARPPAVIGLLRALHALSPLAIEALTDLATPPIHNVAGLMVGDLRFSEKFLI